MDSLLLKSKYNILLFKRSKDVLCVSKDIKRFRNSLKVWSVGVWVEKCTKINVLLLSDFDRRRENFGLPHKVALSDTRNFDNVGFAMV